MGEAGAAGTFAPSSLSEALLSAAKEAFTWSHSVALSSAGSMLIVLAVGMWFSLAKVQRQ